MPPPENEATSKMHQALDVVIGVMQNVRDAQQEAVKLDRSRWEQCDGCELCKNDSGSDGDGYGNLWVARRRKLEEGTM